MSFYILNSMLQNSKKFSLSLRQSFIYINIKVRERGHCRGVTFVLTRIVGSKSKSIYLRDFKDVDFNFTHFANFKFAYFEIEVSFWLIWLNLQMADFTCKFPFWVLKRSSFQVKLYFCSFCV